MAKKCSVEGSHLHRILFVEKIELDPGWYFFADDGSILQTEIDLRAGALVWWLWEETHDPKVMG